MFRPFLLAAALSVGLGSVSAVQAQSDVQRSALHDYRVVTVADGLVVPWSMAPTRAMVRSFPRRVGACR